jgi:hypothetical protein
MRRGIDEHQRQAISFAGFQRLLEIAGRGDQHGRRLLTKLLQTPFRPFDGGLLRVDIDHGHASPLPLRLHSPMQGERAFACATLPCQNTDSFHNYIFQYLNISI